MAKHGSVCEFNIALEDWKTYREAGTVLCSQRRHCSRKEKGYSPQCVWCVGLPAHSQFIVTSYAERKSFAEIVTVMCDHYHPQPSIIVQRYTFNSRSRKEGESIAIYVAELN